MDRMKGLPASDAPVDALLEPREQQMLRAEYVRIEGWAPPSTILALHKLSGLGLMRITKMVAGGVSRTQQMIEAGITRDGRRFLQELPSLHTTPEEDAEDLACVGVDVLPPAAEYVLFGSAPGVSASPPSVRNPRRILGRKGQVEQVASLPVEQASSLQDEQVSSPVDEQASIPPDGSPEVASREAETPAPVLMQVEQRQQVKTEAGAGAGQGVASRATAETYELTQFEAQLMAAKSLTIDGWTDPAVHDGVRRLQNLGLMEVRDDGSSFVRKVIHLVARPTPAGMKALERYGERMHAEARRERERLDGERRDAELRRREAVEAATTVKLERGVRVLPAHAVKGRDFLPEHERMAPAMLEAITKASLVDLWVNTDDLRNVMVGGSLDMVALAAEMTCILSGMGLKIVQNDVIPAETAHITLETSIPELQTAENV